ncbi:tyrosine-type recombinase/integrase [Virgisporangium aurantiacum]|uniref:tyrosine-type recombinase/integrase n=1 Tax=Virgisporangium aurantiacum TaxID=175570 RepID=UPI0019502F6D|nr:tyrosine-type recombinase/integrase [Virgisporangium aurantiacum]
MSSDQLVLRAAVAAYLGRYRGQTRLHTNSDLRIFLRWCDEQKLFPLSAVRTDIERYVRWLQEVRRFQPSTVSRRLSIVGRAIDRAVGDRDDGPILRNMLGGRMDRHAATRRLKHLAATAGIRMPRMHPHMLRHTFVTTMLDAGVSLRDVQIAARHADPRTTMRYDRARKNLDRHANYILAAFMASGT